MKTKQIIVLISPLVLIGMMYPVFQLFAGEFGETIGWYFGLISYWIIWGGIFPLMIIGKQGVIEIIRPQKLSLKIALLVLFPAIMTTLYRFVPGMGYEKPSIWVFLLLLSTAFGNGFFEELLWRGVYMKMFPNKLIFRIIWPSIWFALWHYAPGSIHSDGNVIALMVGAGIFGLYLSFLAKQTDTAWWSIVAHALSGIVMVV
jgi:membrane protease YdiL (CAAX protease family)